ncbi:MAG: ribosome small subunit-dependent GTPase A [Christensenellaceae bacterium]
MHLLETYGASAKEFAYEDEQKNLFLARVIAQHKNLYRVITSCGARLARISGKFLHQTELAADYPAVGDYVLINKATERENTVLIEAVLPRKSLLTRTFIGRTESASEKRLQVMAANIDIVFICMSLNQNFNLSRLERYLSIAWDSGATPVIVLTKADLCEEREARKREVEEIALGVAVIMTSDKEMVSYEILRAYLKPGMTATFIGGSGVGKSTLINLLAGAPLLAVNEIRSDDKGRHTTTSRALFTLPTGGVVIDTPGIRELGVENSEVGRAFAEIEALAAQCKFSDCKHEKEPGCAVRKALEEGEIDARRLENYKKLERESGYGALSSRKREEEKINRMFGGKKNMKAFRRSVKKK